MHKSNLVGIHETRIAHHVAAIGQVDREHGAASILDCARAMIVQFLVVMGGKVATRKHLFDVGQKLCIDRHHVFEVTVHRAILDHPNLIVALDDLRFDLANLVIQEDGDIFLTAEDLFARFNHAVRTQ